MIHFIYYSSIVNISELSSKLESISSKKSEV